MDFTLIRSRRKTIAIIVDLNGNVTVRAPLRVPLQQIYDFVHSKEGWIRTKQERIRSIPNDPPITFQTGEEFLFLGQRYPLEIKGNVKAPLILNRQFELSSTHLSKALTVFTRWYCQQAIRVFSERASYYASQTGLRYKRIRISSARTRWGSCSSRGTLSFTWRLVMAPMTIIDYVVVHELVHTQVRNHSRLFWEQVQTILPDYKNRIRWLKENGVFLTID